MTITNENDLARIREMLASPDLAPIARDVIEPMLEALLLSWADNEKAKNARVPTEIFCPLCNHKHVDQDEWAHEIAHRKHLCAQCGHVWAPYDVGTVGVSFGALKQPVAEYVQMLNRDIAFVQSEWSAAGEEIQKLEKRRDELLQMVANLSQSVPLDSEVGEALNQRGALLAEVGTLKAAIAEHETLFAQASTDREFFKNLMLGIRSYLPRVTPTTVEGIVDAVRALHDGNEQLVTMIEELQIALKGVCAIATTPLPEDRQTVLAAARLANKAVPL